MADNTERKILIDVEIKATEALKRLAELKIQSENLKKEQKDLKTSMREVDASTEEGAKKQQQLTEEYEALGRVWVYTAVEDMHSAEDGYSMLVENGSK